MAALFTRLVWRRAVEIDCLGRTDNVGIYLETRGGDEYNPGYDSWASHQPLQRGPLAAELQTAVWTGSEMIIWEVGT